MKRSVDILIENIDKFLKKSGKTNYWLSKESGVNQATVSRLMRGSVNPSLDSVDAIAKAIKVTPGELITDKAAPKIPSDILTDLENQTSVVYDAVRSFLSAIIKTRKAKAPSSLAAPSGRSK